MVINNSKWINVLTANATEKIDLFIYFNCESVLNKSAI